MSNELKVSENELTTVLQNSLYIGASPQSIDLVKQYCRAASLDVMLKPVHIVPMWDSKLKGMRDVIMPGIGLYRLMAARSGDCAGVSEPEYGPDVTEVLSGVQITYPAWCKITVKRQLASGLIAEFTAVERWKENYAVKGGADKSIAPNAMWTKRAYGQLAKCAEAQALRKGWPECGSAPTAEEMEGKSFERDITPAEPEQRVAPELLPIPVERLANYVRAVAGGKPADGAIDAITKKYTITEAQKEEIQAAAVIDGELMENGNE